VFSILLMLIFTLLWLDIVSTPILAYWTVNYYKNVIDSEAYYNINDAKTLTKWLSDSVSTLLYPENASEIAVGKLCLIEYNTIKREC
jgi:hypothetical protein